MNSTWAPWGIHTRSSALATPRPIDLCINSANTRPICAGSGMMSTLPSSAWAILRISETFQSTPTPRASTWKWPTLFAIAASSWALVSLWFSPSVSRMACFCPSGPTEANNALARFSHAPMAVPPSERK